MLRIRIREPAVLRALHGWTLVDDHGLPRYWATVWSSLDGASLQDSTLSGKLGVIERLYALVRRR